MQPIDDDEDNNLRRMERHEWLCRLIGQAAREADARRRLEDALRRGLTDEPPDYPPDRRAA